MGGAVLVRGILAWKGFGDVEDSGRGGFWKGPLAHEFFLIPVCSPLN